MHLKFRNHLKKIKQLPMILEIFCHAHLFTLDQNENEFKYSKHHN